MLLEQKLTILEKRIKALEDRADARDQRVAHRAKRVACDPVQQRVQAAKVALGALAGTQLGEDAQHSL